MKTLSLGGAAALFFAAQGSAVSAQASEPGPPSAKVSPIALMIDISSGQVLFARNADRRFLPASMTKTMTVFLAFELMEEGTLVPTRQFTMSQDASEEWSGKGSTMFLEAGDVATAHELVGGIANVSANDGSIVLASGVAGSVESWIEAMNVKAREIGMLNSSFGTPNGWPDEGRTFTTANDLALLARTMLDRHPQRYSAYVGLPEYSFKGITQPNRDPLLGRVAGADGIKTGFTSESGHGFLGTAKRGEQRLVMVIGGIERNAERARVARSFMEWGFENFDRQEIIGKGVVVGSARVQGGDTRSVTLMTDRNVFANIPKGQQAGMTMEIVYDGPVRAPIAQGDEVARLKVNIPGMKPAIVPLIAVDEVGEAGILDRIWNGFAGWFS